MCAGCMACVDICPRRAISVVDDIVCVLSCPFQRYLTSVAVKYKEEKSMEAKMIKGSAAVTADVLFILQAVGTNLLATALLA